MFGIGVGILYFLVNWFGYIGFMIFFGFVIFIFFFCYLVNNFRVIKVSVFIIVVVGLVFLVFDVLLFNCIGFYISFYVVDLLCSEV